VKIRGFRIELGEIEAKLASQPGVKEAVVLAREDGGGEKRLVAYYLPESGSECDAESLRSRLQSQLPEYMVPVAFVSLEAWPLTSNGKLDRNALPAPEAGLSSGRPYVAPRTPIEEVLAAIWIELLGVERVGVHDNFFDLGGHSLMAMRLMAAIRETLGINFPLKTFFESPTIEHMGNCLLPDQVEDEDEPTEAQSH
jgi:acyl carrier protein